jgi:zinc transport system substrate-binding protein
VKVAALAFFAALAWAGAAERPLAIVTSFYPIYIHTLNVAGGVPGVTVTNLTAPTTGCLHDYQLRPAEMKTLMTADLLVVNGAGMEAFLAKAIQRHPTLPVIDASAGCDLLRGEGHDGHGHDHAEDEGHGHGHGAHAAAAPNPHVWVGVSGAIRQVRTIAEGLAKADPGRAERYRANAATYVGKLEALKARMHAALDGLPNRRIVTFHEAFPYFAQEFGLTIAAVVQREPGSEPNARELAETIMRVKAAGIRAIFVEPQYPDKAARAIARETGAAVHVLDPAVTGPLTADAYLRIMERNLEVLKAALR